MLKAAAHTRHWRHRAAVLHSWHYGMVGGYRMELTYIRVRVRVRVRVIKIIEVRRGALARTQGSWSPFSPTPYPSTNEL